MLAKRPDQMNKISHHLEISSQLCRQCTLVPRPPPRQLVAYGKQQKAEVRTWEDGYGYNLNRICCWVHEEAPCTMHPGCKKNLREVLHAGLLT